MLGRNSKPKNSCPSKFTAVDNKSSNVSSSSCYFISTRRKNWENAKKLCESRNSQLIAFETLNEKKYLLEYLLASRYRNVNSRKTAQTDFQSEYWTAGSDMTQEGIWLWSGSKTLVGNIGWRREKKPESKTENCLSWSLTLITSSDVSSQVKEGWVSSWCLKNLRYICELHT